MHLIEFFALAMLICAKNSFVFVQTKFKGLLDKFLFRGVLQDFNLVFSLFYLRPNFQLDIFLGRWTEHRCTRWVLSRQSSFTTQHVQSRQTRTDSIGSAGAVLIYRVELLWRVKALCLKVMCWMGILNFRRILRISLCWEHLLRLLQFGRE